MQKVERDNSGAIVLCGGKSSRMGTPKALLPFGPELMLPRVVRLVSQVVPAEHIVVVAAADQQLPELPANIIIARDEHPKRGPLEGLAAGLRALPTEVEAAYATSCDVPLLMPAFVERLFTRLGKQQIAVAMEVAQRAGQKKTFHHPLAAVYRTSVLPVVETLLAADRLRPFFLFKQCDTQEVPVEQLREVDPELQSLLNCNTPEDYQQALELAGGAR